MLSRKAEDYLEAILNIKDEQGYVRVKNISASLNVKPPSVVEMLKRLDREGLVRYERHNGVELTEKGYRLAIAVKEKHDAIKAFLKIIRVPEKIAERDACTMEHGLDLKTITQIKALVEFVERSPIFPDWLKHFETFCKTGKHFCEKRSMRRSESLQTIEGEGGEKRAVERMKLFEI